MFFFRLQTDGLCDRRKRRCKKVSVLGTGYLNSTNVTCHVEEMEVLMKMLQVKIIFRSKFFNLG